MPIKARLLAAQAQGRQRWQALAPRERRVVALAAALLCTFLGWQLLIAPALARIDYWAAETPKLRSQAQALETLLAQHQVARPADITGALRQSLEQAGLGPHSHLAAEGSGSQLSWQQAPAEAAMAWLQGVPPGLGLHIGELSLQRDGDAESAGPVTFSGTLRMDQAPGAKDPS